ncbi:uncharacterized protein EHS24_002224 [Apiotrichum porosum]|uniref:Uncharacterized protein n=1 Tax=Apiotrichum porosum TaxID=105984 RepID=A0A427XHW8_9TREE|nr:uncharacterized protein EHS24_002224 [Apiotrichum porosum]RSH78499.1 hypothetical protein EHS24_002224 [Apiotrichum porosum]
MSTAALPTPPHRIFKDTVFLVQSVGCKRKQVGHFEREIVFRGGAFTRQVTDPSITHVLIWSVLPAPPGPYTAPQDINVNAWSGHDLVTRFTSDEYSNVIVVNTQFFVLCRESKALLGEDCNYGGMRIKSVDHPGPMDTHIPVERDNAALPGIHAGAALVIVILLVVATLLAGGWGTEAI